MTRLLLIAGACAVQYDGTSQTHIWHATDTITPENVDDLLPEVFDDAWKSCQIDTFDRKYIEKSVIF